MTKFSLLTIFLFLKTLSGLSNSVNIADSTFIQTANSSISIFGGTTGIGAELSYLFIPKSRLYFRVGISHMAYSKPYNYEYNTRSFIKIDPDLKLGIIYTGIDYLPFKKSSLYITTGIGYTHNVKTAISAYTTTGLDINGTFISAEDFGKIDFEVKWNKIVPFIGFGIGRTIPKKRIGVSAEIGTYYIGNPKLFMEYTGILEITNIDEVLPKIERNMSEYVFLPYLMVKLRYGIQVGTKNGIINKSN